jgi:capsular polysaccharide transport system permease protein
MPPPPVNAPVDAAPKQIVEPVGESKFRKRHRMILVSFVLLVMIPAAILLGYLYLKAHDQYASYIGFTVQSEAPATDLSFLGGLTGISNSGSSDTDILYEFIQSQQMVAEVDAALNLRSLYTKPTGDFYYAFDAEGSIEDLHEYWKRMVKINYDSGTGLIELRVNAFTPDDAKAIADQIFERSSIVINRISAIAREDAIKFARDDLGKAVERLKKSRQEITTFRNLKQIVDPSSDIQGQLGLLNSMQQRLADEYIELDLLAGVTRQNDPRVEQAQRRIKVIEARITEERKKFGLGEDGSNEAFANVMGEFEALVVDREFAEASYLSAQAVFDNALAASNRQSRYLASYLGPTTAEASKFPKRGILSFIVIVILLLTWAIGVLVTYSIWDRR